ncbi:GTP 3',8-cyclase MoaA [Lampropedia puyangensis]|uniref:GTP 3',8-cyclase n=1 Tax=Lampropedia puyangensis TaxID=1330072 RepID=A0A4S8EU93_9BURK|nr:GTP 3',8-cyclase MoaA [Lampropedia puyangensis]THT98427.1 GTP 3',8-cyclase MoaA [Lampropedia puyangensis]
MTDHSSPALIDSFNRRISYLRVSITDRCDLRCNYCMPKDFKDFEEPINWLSHTEMARLVGVFVDLGVNKIRLTGGEPLTRKGVADLAGQIRALSGVKDLSLSTNATMLARHAVSLKAAGVDRLNVSLDTLDEQRFCEITGRNCLSKVLEGLNEARRVGFAPIKLNCVVDQSADESDLSRLLAYSLASGFILRLIETMPMGSSGQQFVAANLSDMGEAIAQRFGLVPALDFGNGGPARYWSAGENRPALGVITPMSRHFCETCNRVRLTVDGTLHLCLGQENQVPLGQMLRQGACDAELKAAIHQGIAAKPERHEFSSARTKVMRFMSQTGG